MTERRSSIRRRLHGLLQCAAQSNVPDGESIHTQGTAEEGTEGGDSKVQPTMSAGPSIDSPPGAIDQEGDDQANLRALVVTLQETMQGFTELLSRNFRGVDDTMSRDIVSALGQAFLAIGAQAGETQSNATEEMLSIKRDLQIMRAELRAMRDIKAAMGDLVVSTHALWSKDAVVIGNVPKLPQPLSAPTHTDRTTSCEDGTSIPSFSPSTAHMDGAAAIRTPYQADIVTVQQENISPSQQSTASPPSSSPPHLSLPFTPNTIITTPAQWHDITLGQQPTVFARQDDIPAGQPSNASPSSYSQPTMTSSTAATTGERVSIPTTGYQSLASLSGVMPAAIIV